jgi:hypothetical protein
VAAVEVRVATPPPYPIGAQIQVPRTRPSSQSDCAAGWGLSSTMGSRRASEVGAETRASCGRDFFVVCSASTGSAKELFLETPQRNHRRETMTEKTIIRHVKIAGQPFVLRNSDVLRAVRKVDPEPITSHFVVIAGRRFPPKQVLSEATGLDRADFTTHQARRTLIRLGFSAGRRPSTSARTRSGNTRGQRPRESERLGDRLRALAGEWVAIKDDDVLHAANTPRELVEWLSQHGQKADSMFRVPEDELAATGLAPL